MIPNKTDILLLSILVVGCCILFAVIGIEMLPAFLLSVALGYFVFFSLSKPN